MLHIEACAACRHRMHHAHTRAVGRDVAARDRFARETNDALACALEVETKVDDRRSGEMAGAADLEKPCADGRFAALDYGLGRTPVGVAVEERSTMYSRR